jgi:integrase
MKIQFVQKVSKKSNNWYFVRDIPKELRSAFGGKKRWLVSLKTCVQAEAAKEARRWALDTDRLIDAARKPTVVQTDEDKAMLKYLDGRAAEMAGLRDEASWMREWAAAKPGLAFEDHREGKFQEESLPDPHWAHAEAAAMDAKVSFIEGEIARASGLVNQDNIGEVPELASALESLPPDAERMTMMSLYEAWRVAKGARMPKQYQVSAAYFEQRHGALLLSQINKDHVRKFRDWLATVDGLAEITAANHFGRVKSLFKFAESERFIDDSPATKIDWNWTKQKFSAEKVECRQPFAPREVGALLRAADALPADDRVKLDTKWGLRLGLFTGMRGEEISQLTPDDVMEIGGVPVIKIHDAGHRKIKTAASARDVPIHAALIDMGFLDFVKARRGGKMLFATLTPSQDGRFYGCMQGRLTRLIRRVVPDKRVSPHSFRDTMADSLRLIKVPDAVEDGILGHTREGRKVARGYGKGIPVVVLAEWINKVNLEDEERC